MLKSNNVGTETDRKQISPIYPDRQMVVGRKACMKLSLQGTWESWYKRECALPATDSVQSVASWGLQYVSPCEKQNHQLRTQSICNKLIVIFIKHNKEQTIDHNHM